MKRWVLLLTALGVLVAGGAADAQAESTTPSPSPSALGSSTSAADPAVRDFDGEVREVIFPEADADGSVTETGTQIMLKADVFFDYRKATLNAAAGAALDRAVQRLNELGATKVRIVGYTDDVGSKASNRSLSKRRAQAVQAALVALLPELGSTVEGKGESHPVATNETAKGRALNRRVTITVTG
ncbi:OmpA family protein [Micropruina sp.]|uniref:OmpA family protein n=1 Tax=Micropruina sp. TaxID=2737536 RepID=UPI0039E494BE